MRPLFRVVFVPSIPMKDDRLSTAGSFRIAWVRSCCSLGHLRERNRLLGFRDALNHASVLNREEALGDIHRTYDGQGEGPMATSRVTVW